MRKEEGNKGKKAKAATGDDNEQSGLNADDEGSLTDPGSSDTGDQQSASGSGDSGGDASSTSNHSSDKGDCSSDQDSLWPFIPRLHLNWPLAPSPSTPNPLSPGPLTPPSSSTQPFDLSAHGPEGTRPIDIPPAPTGGEEGPKTYGMYDPNDVGKSGMGLGGLLPGPDVPQGGTLRPFNPSGLIIKGKIVNK
jgi:hypothetical protein